MVGFFFFFFFERVACGGIESHIFYTLVVPTTGPLRAHHILIFSRIFSHFLATIGFVLPKDEAATPAIEKDRAHRTADAVADSSDGTHRHTSSLEEG